MVKTKALLSTGKSHGCLREVTSEVHQRGQRQSPRFPDFKGSDWQDLAVKTLMSPLNLLLFLVLSVCKTNKSSCVAPETGVCLSPKPSVTSQSPQHAIFPLF